MGKRIVGDDLIIDEVEVIGGFEHLMALDGPVCSYFLQHLH
jgi:hypothetical protein